MPSRADAGSAFSHCETLLREGDHDRYLASLFAPADRRRYLMALYAFNHEIARIRDSVREALPGEIRMQWWRDALQGEARGDVRANPVAAALDDTIVQCRLPRQPFVDLIDARVFDLYEDPMPTLADLDGYCGETSSRLIRLATLILAPGGDPGSADAAGHAGLAYAITGLLRAFPWHSRRGQIYVPQDVLSRHGVVQEDIMTGRGGPGLDEALAAIRAVARHHVERFWALKATITPDAAPAFVPVGLVEPYLRQMERPGYDPFRTVVDLPVWRKLWALWRTGKRL